MNVKPIINLLRRTPAGVLALGVSGALLAGPPPEGRGVSIRLLDNTVRLSWNGITNAPYDVQARTNLTLSGWSTLTTVNGLDGDTAYSPPAGDSPSRFFRVLFPQPAVVASEPGLYAQGTGGAYLYITGKFFYNGDRVLIGGAPAANPVFVSPTLLRVDLPPGLAPGRYDVSVVSGTSGLTLATLPEALEVTDPAADPYRLLYEPPQWPPAGPSGREKKGLNAVNVKLALLDDLADARFLSKKGYDYYQAQSELNAAGRKEKTGHVTLIKFSGDEESDARWLAKKGYDYYKALSEELTASGRKEKTGHVTLIKFSGEEDADARLALALHSGEVEEQTTDLFLPGRGLDFAWTRTYRSRTGPNSPQGQRWTHCYDVGCAASGSDIVVYDGTGRRDLYRSQPGGIYSCPGFFREGAFTGGVFRLTFANAGFWEFRALDATPAAGKLARIEDRNGNALILGYDGSGRLAQITDTLGRVHTVTYTAEGRVSAVIDSTKRAVTYAYYADGEAGGSAGDLKSATSPPVTGTPTGNDFPEGKTVRYTYTTGQSDPRANHLLLTFADALGQTVLRCTYDMNPASPAFQRCVAAQRAADPPTCVTHLFQTPSPENLYAATRCLVNDPVGNVRECAFDARNRCVAERAYTGRATPGLPVTDASNRPTGKLRSDDPDWFLTTYAWNRDSCLIGGALPGGNILSSAYEADLNPFAPPRKRGDLRTLTERAAPGGGADTDGDGVPDLFEITQQFTYDPRFGTCEPGARRVHAIHNAPAARQKQWLCSNFRLKLSSAKRLGIGATAPQSPLGIIEDGRDNDCDGFVTTCTDPSGTVTTAEYDSRGNAVSAITHVHGDPHVEQLFDAFGQLTSYIHPADAAGVRKIDAFAWHQGMVTQIVEDAASGGLRLTTGFECDSRGCVTRVIDPRGHDALIAYNALRQPVTVGKQTQAQSFGERVRSSLYYDANDNLVRVDRDNRDASGALDPANPQWSTWFAYDALSRTALVGHELAHTVQQRVMTNAFVYDATDQVVLHRLPEAAGGAEPSNTVAYAYDERGLLFSEERAPGTGLSTVDTYDYDGNGNLRRVSKIDAFTLKQKLYHHDGFDRCVATLDPMGNVATRCFDAAGNLRYLRADGETPDVPGGKGNRKLAEARYSYDGLNRRISCVDSFFDIFTELAVGDGASQTTFAYAPNGQLTSATNDSGAAATFAYDRVGRLASITDPKGNATAYGYDPNGNVLSITRSDRSDVSAGEQLFSSASAYDAFNRCVATRDNVGNAVSNAYDSCDNLVCATDPSGNDTVRTYDGLGRVLDTVHYDGAKERGITINTTHVEYQNMRRISETDGNTNVTAYTYDACDRCSSVTHADGTVESLVWSPRSNLARGTDPNGTTVTNTYDLCDRLIHRDIAARTGVMATTTFEQFAYDGLGRLVAAENDGSTLTYTYDSLGNCVASSQDGYTTTAAFDGLGNRRVCTCPSGRVIACDYDSLSRPASITVHPNPSDDTDLLLATFAYDGPDRLAKITRSNGINTRVFWNGQQNAPNADGDYGWQQVARINHARAGGGEVVDQRTSAYDRSQNKTLRVMTAPWASGAALTTNVYGYDKLHRLTRARKSGSIVYLDRDYVLDANGNRLQVTNGGIVESYAMNAALPEPADAQMNQYTESPTATYTYDANGNRKSGSLASQTVYYRYDYADRLVQVDSLSNEGVLSTVAAYSYDPLGRRIGKTVFPYGLPPLTTTYVYDDNKDDDCDGYADADVLETYENGALKRTYVAPHVFEARLTQMTVAADGQVLFFHEDELGNTLALTDGAGSVVERYDYDEFGAPLFFDAAGSPLASSSAGNDILFRGMRWDAEVSLYSAHRAGAKQSNPLYEEGTQAGMNPLYESQARTAGLQNNPAFQENNTQGSMPDHRGARGGGGGGGGGCGGVLFDPEIGQTLQRSGGAADAGDNGRSFSGNNPWSSAPPAMKKGTVKFFNETKGFGFIKAEEGGRHTPFHNRSGWESITTPGIRINTKTFASVSNVLKTKHDTVKNSIGNIR